MEDSDREVVDKADYKAAIIELKSALKVAPNQADARFLLAKALLESGSLAMRRRRHARRLGSTTRQTMRSVASGALLAEGEYEKVVAQSDRELMRPVARADVETLRARADLAMRDQN